jgi:phosphoesterase RecJ-like protein
MVIDHHILPADRWWDACFHDVTASSTGVLVARIASALKVELDKVAALGVFTSIVTDTGWFKYSNTDAETFAVAASLVAKGVDVAGQYSDLFQRRPEGHPQGLGKLLTRTEFHEGGRVALLTLPLNPSGQVHEMDTDDALDVVRSVASIEVVLFVREVRPGLCKLSARSKTDFNVAALASTFGGGGHRKAAGATIEGSLEQASRSVLRAALKGLESQSV